MSGAGGEQVHFRTCPLCEAMCGLRLTVRDGRVTHVRGDDEDVWSRGYLCPKGAALGHLHDDPDRLRAPLVRDGARWREVGWDEALDEAERRLGAVRAADGAGAIAAYVGNPTVHNFSLSRYIGAFFAIGGLTQIYSAGTVDQWPKNLVCALMYGGMWTIPVPDLDRTDYLLVLGANPAASQGSLMAAPDALGRLDAIRARGGRVVIVDPRRTRTAARADEWVALRPGTDAALLLAIAQVLFAEGRVRPGRLAAFVRGLDEVERLCRDFAPEAVAATCGVEAATIRRLARELAAAPRAAVYGRIGTCNQEFGTLASWMVEVLNVLTGNLDRPGGAMLADPVAWSLATLRPPEFAGGFTLGRWRSRVRGAPEILGQVPVSCLSEEITVPGHGRIRALVTIAGNPVISTPDAARLDAALPHLACMVSVDNYLNETTRHADVILPGLSPLEQPHHDELIWAWAIRNGARYSPAVFAPPADRPAEWEILLTLAAIAGGQPRAGLDVHALDDAFFAGVVEYVLSGAAGRTPSTPAPDVATVLAATPGRGPARLLDFVIRTGSRGDWYGARAGGLTLAAVAAAPHGIDAGPLMPRLPEALAANGGVIELAPAHVVADLPRLRARLARDDGDALVLVSRRHLRSNNSWMHNLAPLMTGRPRCTLLVHPADAARLGLADGARARVATRAGAIEVPVEVSDEMMPGVVSLPHGFGHDKPGTRLAVAAAHAGANTNVLAPGDLVDVPSGNAVLNGIPVRVTAVS